LLPLHLPLFFPPPSTTSIYTLSLHDALPIFPTVHIPYFVTGELLRRSYDSILLNSISILLFLLYCLLLFVLPIMVLKQNRFLSRSEEHTSELQSRFDLVCRLLLEKKKYYTYH